MPGISLYDVSVPLFQRGLRTFDHILAKAEEYARSQGLDPDAAYPQARLIADQNPLVFQIQNAVKTVKVGIERLTGAAPQGELPFQSEAPATFADLHALIAAAQKLLAAVDASAVNGRAEAVVDVPVAGKSAKLSVKDAILGQSIPNFIFHITTGYSILRAKGVPLGKADFITSFVGL